MRNDAEYTLVILAAGIGARYGGGVKQLKKVGPAGEIIMDYAIYDATELIYTDVDIWLEDFLKTHPDVYCDEQIRRRVRNVYDFYQNRENIRSMYGYLEFPEP